MLPSCFARASTAARSPCSRRTRPISVSSTPGCGSLRFEGALMKVGFIGLGRMGQGMARRILDAGHELAVFDVAAAAAEPLKSAGARVASSPSNVAKGRDVVVTMLVEDWIVADVAFGKGGLCDSLPQGAIHLV